MGGTRIVMRINHNTDVCLIILIKNDMLYETVCKPSNDVASWKVRAWQGQVFVREHIDSYFENTMKFFDLFFASRIT